MYMYLCGLYKILVFFLLFRFAFAPFKVFKDLHIPYIKPESFLGNLREFTTLGVSVTTKII